MLKNIYKKHYKIKNTIQIFKIWKENRYFIIKNKNITKTKKKSSQTKTLIILLKKEEKPEHIIST